MYEFEEEDEITARLKEKFICKSCEKTFPNYQRSEKLTLVCKFCTGEYIDYCKSCLGEDCQLCQFK